MSIEQKMSKEIIACLFASLMITGLPNHFNLLTILITISKCKIKISMSKGTLKNVSALKFSLTGRLRGHK